MVSLILINSTNALLILSCLSLMGIPGASSLIRLVRPTRYTFYSRSAGKVATIPTWYNYGALATIVLGVAMLITLRLLWS